MNNIRVEDDFAPDPFKLRDMALALNFRTMEHGGEKYHGIGLADVDLSREIGAVVGFPVKQRLTFFRLNTSTDEPSTFIHADSSEAQYAGVLHLSVRDFGGTAFWKHRTLRIDRVSAGTEANTPLVSRLNSDGHNEALWEMSGYCGMKFNRFITYPGCMFHSRYPKKTWGETRDESRLIWACFYDRLPREV